MTKSITKNMTTGSPIKLIFFFSLPILCGNLFQQFYVFVDTLIVGRTLGVDALAAVGCTGSIALFITGFVQGLSVGMSMITARMFGSDSFEDVKRSFAANIIIGVFATIILTAICVPFSRKLLIAMNTPAGILDQSHTYISIIALGTFSIVLFNVLSNVLRALGNSRTPLLFLIFASVLNISLDLIFIVIVGTGVEGAAIATVISQLTSGIFCIIFIKFKFPILHLKKQHFIDAKKMILQHLLVGFPMGFQVSIISIGVLIVQIVLNAQGEQTVAAYTAVQKMELVFTSPLMAFGIAMATYTSQNYGAGKLERISQGVRACLTISLSYVAVIMLMVTFFGDTLVSVFLENEPEVIAMSSLYWSITSKFYPTLSILFIIRYTLQGVGQSIIPVFAGTMELIMRGVGCVLLVAPLGFTGICIAYALAWPGSMVPLVISYFITMRKLQKNPIKI